MDFPTWLALHRRSLDTLPVRPGDYMCRYRAGAEERYSAALRLSQHAAGTLVCVSTAGGVRARVHHEGGEYLFQPVWGGERGLRVHRLSPGGSLPRDLGETVCGCARAALVRAAEEAFDELQGLAAEAFDYEDDVERAVVALTTPTRETTESDRAIRAHVAATLAERDGGALVHEVVQPCTCLACGAAFERGDRAAVWHFGTLVCCDACLRPAARAA